MASLVGQTIGQYEIVEHLGQGGMADVYKAFHPGLAIYRALKVIRTELGAGSDFKERFQREAQAVAGLRHSNIVRMQDFGIHEGLYYMVMEFIEGRDLKAMLTERGPIRPLTEIVDIISQVAAALTYAHEQDIVHRDVKPANMMCTTDGQVILTDFGIAKILTTDEPITQTGVGIGTPAYMSPEQAQGLPTVGPPTDIYSLGVVLYQMISGRVPYSADTPMAVALKVLNEPLPPLQAEVSDGIRSVVRKATAKKPANRYDSANALAEALEEAVAAEPASTGETVTMALDAPESSADAPDDEPVSEPAPASTTSGGSGILIVLLLVLVLAGGAGAGLYFFRGAWMPLLAPAEEPPTTATTAGQNDPAAEGLAADSVTGEAGADTTAASPALAAEREFDTPGGEAGADASTSRTSETTVTREATASPEASSQDTSEPASPEGETSASSDTPSAAEASEPESSASESQEPVSSDPSAETRRPPGAYVEDAITIPGQTATFTYEGEAGEQVYFDFVSSTADADFVLRGPDGTQVLKAFMEDAGPVTLDQTGTYTLTVDPWGQGTPTFAFSLVNRAEVTPDATGAIQPNEPVQGALSTAGETATFTYEGEAGEQVYFDFVSSTADADFVLRGPDGTQVLKAFMEDAGPVTLDQTGTYTLTVDPWGQGTPSFEFVLRRQ